MRPRSASRRLPTVERLDPAGIERDRIALEGARQRALALLDCMARRDERVRQTEQA